MAVDKPSSVATQGQRSASFPARSNRYQMDRAKTLQAQHTYFLSRVMALEPTTPGLIHSEVHRWSISSIWRAKAHLLVVRFPSLFDFEPIRICVVDPREIPSVPLSSFRSLSPLDNEVNEPAICQLATAAAAAC
jgi:hypothetical protein